MPEQRITIEIDEDGKISAKTAGFVGETCLDELQELIEQDNSLLSIKPTDSYYQKNKEKITETLNVRGGSV